MNGAGEACRRMTMNIALRTSENDELVTHLVTHELNHYYNCNYCFTLVIPYMHIVPYKYQYVNVL